eukprot:m.48341 g.48341  ORF g.48341 m.48341 type:complete len:325 (-) comp13281_c0_seq2:91-1065(-)
MENKFSSGTEPCRHEAPSSLKRAQDLIVNNRSAIRKGRAISHKLATTKVQGVEDCLDLLTIADPERRQYYTCGREAVRLGKGLLGGSVDHPGHGERKDNKPRQLQKVDSSWESGPLANFLIALARRCLPLEWRLGLVVGRGLLNKHNIETILCDMLSEASHGKDLTAKLCTAVGLLVQGNHSAALTALGRCSKQYRRLFELGQSLYKGRWAAFLNKMADVTDDPEAAKVLRAVASMLKAATSIQRKWSSLTSTEGLIAIRKGLAAALKLYPGSFVLAVMHLVAQLACRLLTINSFWDVVVAVFDFLLDTGKFLDRIEGLLYSIY